MYLIVSSLSASLKTKGLAFWVFVFWLIRYGIPANQVQILASWIKYGCGVAFGLIFGAAGFCWLVTAKYSRLRLFSHSKTFAGPSTERELQLLLISFNAEAGISPQAVPEKDNTSPTKTVSNTLVILTTETSQEHAQHRLVTQAFVNQKTAGLRCFGRKSEARQQ